MGKGIEDGYIEKDGNTNGQTDRDRQQSDLISFLTYEYFQNKERDTNGGGGGKSRKFESNN
jgi:hypothetical protein